MCTALTYKTKDFYFGRTLDYEHSFAEKIVITPRKFPLPFRTVGTNNAHYAIIGMACVANGFPLYFDAVNEKGLAMAGLNFPGYAVYKENTSAKDNIASFEFIPWILSQCSSVRQARALLERINITEESFSREIPPAPLHWILADDEETITIEAVQEGVRVYPNPVGVLTNNPPFEAQLCQLCNFMHLSPKTPENRFSKKIPLHPYSRGMGALGLPGDLSSQSRFVRAAFVKLNSLSGSDEGESVSQFFHILGAVDQPRGCCDLGDGQHEITIYTSCCNVSRGIYYYTTYDNRQISAVSLHGENLNTSGLICFPLKREGDVFWHNEKPGTS